ncbi:MAG: DUF2797 domain-containing protein [Immundisolibacteraceae bacterium]|nr:DUF2797 domain-containing protein [Immundisolibacteraceae bacterium]
MSITATSVTGALRKLVSEPGAQINYWLPLGDEQVYLNDYLGKPISLTYGGEIICIACGRRTNKSFSQGHCYPCFTGKAACDMCILKPELCHYEAGTCREPQWGEEFCFQPHIIYLANTTGPKVGITRKTQLPTRWIDQGAVAALPIFEVSTRHISGQIEVALAEFIADKSRWQQLLKAVPEPVDLLALRDQALEWSSSIVAEIRSREGDDAVIELSVKPAEFEFPVVEYPEKIKSFNFDKGPQVEGRLQGIKGQYLLLDTGVINIRKFGGYKVRFEA